MQHPCAYSRHAGRSELVSRWGAMLALVALGFATPVVGQNLNEEVLFFDARADQTATSNGGAVIYRMNNGPWRFWFQGVLGSTVSPSGKKVAYVFNGGVQSYTGSLLVAEISGQNPTLVKSNVATHPIAWSPSGDRLAYMTRNPYDIVVCDLSGTPLLTHRLRGTSTSFSWSPDGTEIAFSDLTPTTVPDQLPVNSAYALNVTTGFVRTIYEGPVKSLSPGEGYIETLGGLSWSPDGTRIAALWMAENAAIVSVGWEFTVERNVVVMPASGGPPTRITQYPSHSRRGVFPVEGPVYNIYNATWSPDGSEIAYSIIGTDVSPGIYRIPAGGGHSQRVNGFVPGFFNGYGGVLQWTVLNRTTQLSVKIAADITGSPLRIDDTGVATIRVEHLDSDPVTYSFPDGLASVAPAGALEFEPLAPIRPFTLSADDRVRQFEVPFTAREIGTATVTSTLALSGSPNLVMAEAEVAVMSLGDLLIKRSSQPPEAFGENDVYQNSPLGQQRERISVLQGETAHFDIKVENDNSVPASFHVMASEDPDDQWITAYFLNGVEITAAILSDEGYPTGELAAGASLVINADFTPVTAVDGGEKNVLILLTDDDNNLVDTLDATAKRSDIVLFLSMHEVDIAGVTEESLLDGLTEIDAPLIPVTATAVLDTQKEVLYGLVADGVTPLLFRIEADPQLLENLDEDLEVRLALTTESGGSLANGALATRLRVLAGGAWVPGDQVTLTADEPVTFAYIAPIPADDLRFSSRPGEIASQLEARNIDTDETIESLEFYLRKPPIILIHGYNTPGDWGSAFVHELHESRPPNKVSFVRTGKYGQEVLSSGFVKDLLNKANPAFVNTIYPLRDLVSIASAQAFDREIAHYDGAWAVTRHDVIAHSQGGVLSRMLCTENINLFLPRRFRSQQDFLRGRFHRVVTVGSPQNGSRTLYYMRALRDHRSWKSILNSLPGGVVELMVQLDVAQYKFDPFALEIQQINAPSGSLWRTDPAAKFHIIRTTVNDAQPPGRLSSPSDFALGFNAIGGMLVLPSGSDGVVDWDSMGCHGPGGVAAPNVFTVSGEQIAHASATLFGGDDSQTASVIVARHARAALDQTGAAPEDIRFGSFPLPPLLPQSVRDDIDLWASLVTFDFGTSIKLLDPVVPGNVAPGPVAPMAAVASTSAFLSVALDPSPGMDPIGSVNWTVEVYDHRGVSGNRLTAFPDPVDPFAATIDLPPGFVGQVVVYANYEAATNTIVMAAPFLALDVPPSGATATGVQIIPSETVLPAGSGVPVRAAIIYDTGEIIPAFVSAQNFTAQSSDPSILDVSDPLFWSLLRAGTATVTGTFMGIPYTAEMGVIREGDALTRLNISLMPHSGPIFTWPSVLAGFELERSTNLLDWEPVTGVFGKTFGFNSHIDDTGAPQAFYRLVHR